MTLKNNWGFGDTLQPSDVNAIANAVNNNTGAVNIAANAVDIRNYITSGSTFNLAAVVAAMEAGGGACYIPPGDWTPNAYNVGLNETAVTGGANYTTTFTYKFVGAGRQSKIVLPSGMTSTDFLMVANSSNSDTYHVHPKVVMEDFAVWGTNSPNGSLLKLNQRSFSATRVYLHGLLNGFYTTGYADLCSIKHVYADSMTAGGWVLNKTSNGDGLIVDGLFMYPDTGGLYVANTGGASIRSCIGGVYKFVGCDMTFENHHGEGTTLTSPTVIFDSCIATVRGGYVLGSPSRPTFQISDTVYGNYTFDNVDFRQRIDDPSGTGYYSPAKGLDVDIAALGLQSEVIFKNCKAYGQFISTTLGNGGGGAAIVLVPKVTASGVSGVQTALTANPLAVVGNSTLRHNGSSWEFGPTGGLPVPTKSLSTPTLSATAILSSFAITTLSAGTYYYKAWVYDVAGRFGAASSEISVTTTSGTPVPYLTFDAGGAPVLFRLVRGTTSGTYTQYVDIPIAEASQTVYDQGTYIGGVPWITGSATLPPSNATQDGMLYSSGNMEIRATAAPTAGTWLAGDRCWNTTPGPPGWVCTSGGVPGTWTETVDVSTAQTLTNKTITSGYFNLLKDANGLTILGMVPQAGAVNSIAVQNNTTGNNPWLTVGGADTNISLTIVPVGTGYVYIRSSTSGQAATLAAAGPDSSHDFNIIPKGTGVVKFNGVAASTWTRNISTVSGSTTLGATASTDYIAFVAAGGAPKLPTAASNTNLYTIKNIDTATHTLTTTSSQTIDGAPSLTLAPNASVELISDGSNWRIL